MRRHIIKQFLLLTFIFVLVSAQVCYADTYSFTDQANYSDGGSGSGNSETHSYSGGAGGGSSNGANTHVDNTNETNYLNARSSVRNVLQSLMARARASQGANTMVGDILNNGSAYTFGYVNPTEAELLALYNGGNDMVANMGGSWRLSNYGLPAGAADITNIYQYLDDMNSTGNNGMPNATVSDNVSVTDGDGDGYAQNESVVGGGNGNNTTISFGGQGVSAQWDDFLSSFFGANGISGVGGGGFSGFSTDAEDLWRRYSEQFGSNLLGPGMIMTDAQGVPSLLPLYNLTPADELGNYTGGIRQDLIPGGFNIANTYAGRFANLGRYTSNAMNNTQCTFGLLTEYRLTNVRTNERTNIHFLGDVRYWRIYDEAGNPVSVNGSYNLVTTNPEHTLQVSGLPNGTYTVRAYQLARYTIQTTVSYMQYEYFFDTSNNSILYFHERQMTPIRLNSTEMQGEIPSRSFQFTSGDLSTESDVTHTIERIE